MAVRTSSETIQRRPPVRPGVWFDVALLACLVGLTALLATGHLLAADMSVAAWVDAHRPVPLQWTLRVLNYLGQGGQVLTPLAVLLAAALVRRRHSVRPLLPVAAAFLLTYVTIGPLKLWFDRAAPHSSLPDRVVLFNSVPSLSYPSGHVANAIVWYGVIVLLVAALRGDRGLSVRARAAMRVLPPAIVFVTTTYLGFHWLTDSIAGLALGWLLGRLLDRVAWDAVPLPASAWTGPAGLDRRVGAATPGRFAAG